MPLLGTYLTSTEAAAIIGVLCQHVLKTGLTHLRQLARSDLSITDDGDLHIAVPSHDTAQLKPALEAMTGLLQELIEVVDAPAPELRLAQRRSDRCAQIDVFADVAELGELMVRSFQLTDSRIVLREVPRRLKAQADEPILVALDMAHGIDEFPSESTSACEQNAPVQGLVPPVHSSATSSNPRSRRYLSAGLTLWAAGLAALAIADFVNDDDRTHAPRTLPTATATVRELPPSESRGAPRQNRSTALDTPNRREEGTRSASVVPLAVATPRDPANAEPRRLARPGS